MTRDHGCTECDLADDGQHTADCLRNQLEDKRTSAAIEAIAKERDTWRDIAHRRQEEADHYRADVKRSMGLMRADMIEIDRLLENDFGGYYLSAPPSDPLGRIRKLLRGEI